MAARGGFTVFQGKSDFGLRRAETAVAGAEGRSRRAAVLRGTSGLGRAAPHHVPATIGSVDIGKV